MHSDIASAGLRASEGAALGANVAVITNRSTKTAYRAPFEEGFEPPGSANT